MNMPQQKKQDYVDFIAARAPRMSVASLKRVVRCIVEETKKPGVASKAPKVHSTKPAPRVHFEDEA